jgi:hypothetical protein
VSPLTRGPLTTSPLTLPSPQRGEGCHVSLSSRGEGVAVPSPFEGEGRVRAG